MATVSALLGIEARPADNFLELGGDSLTAAMVVARLSDYVGRELPLHYVFDSESISELVDTVLRNRHG
jgi:acyl carrier protein